MWKTPAFRALEEAIEHMRLMLRPYMDKHWREIADAKVEVVLRWPSGKWEVVTWESLRRN